MHNIKSFGEGRGSCGGYAHLRLQQAFTLLEVLLAAFILFLAISAMSLVFRGAILSSSKAENELLINRALPFVLDNVRNHLRTFEDKSIQRIDQQGQFLEVNYKWTASVAEYLPPVERFDVDLTEFVTYEPRFKLWQVSLTVEAEDVNRQFEFRELSW